MMIWKKAKEKLLDKLTENVFNLWIEPLEFHSQEGSCLYLTSPDRYFGAYVTQNFLDAITEQVVEVDGSINRVCVNGECHRQPRNNSQELQQLRLPSVPAGSSQVRALHPRYTFDEFMVGESNILAQSACCSISAFDDSFGPCLYITSNTGLGKTHLTHAIAHQILDSSPYTRLHYMTAQQFAAEMVQKIKSNAMDVFKQKYHEQCDILLVEDMQSLTGKKKTQQELNEVLDSLIKCGKRVVMTANSTPRDLVGIDEDFRSRMTSGLVTSIQEPDLMTRNRIIRNKAEQQMISLSDDFIAYLAHHVKGDVRKLESAIIAVKARSALKNGEIDEAIIEEVVASIVGLQRGLTARCISELVSSQFKVPLLDMQSKSRKKSIAFPRQVAMFLSRKHTDETLADIGKVFNRDHSTVMHSIKVVTGLSRRDNSVSAQIDLLSDKVQKL